MLNVASLQNFDFFKNFHLVSGSLGLYKDISNVVILDYEGIEGEYNGFGEGDFVITNLLFAKEHPERIYSAFSTLIDMKVSAFAIKSVFFKELPQEVLALSEKSQTPIFFFNDIFIEDVILNITDFLRSSDNYNYYESLIDSFITLPSPTTAINDLLKFFGNDLSVYHPGLVSTMFLKPHTETDKFSAQRIYHQLLLQLRHLKFAAQVHLISYKKGFLFFGLFEKETSLPNNFLLYWERILSELTIPKENYDIGISDTALPLSKIDIAIKRCLNACKMVSHANFSPCSYSTLGFYNILLPLSEVSYITEYINDLLRNHISGCNSIKDFANHPLYATISSYVQHNFDIEQTATTLFTHPNTIRYRINKFKGMLGIENELEFQMICSLLSLKREGDA